MFTFTENEWQLFKGREWQRLLMAMEAEKKETLHHLKYLDEGTDIHKRLSDEVQDIESLIEKLDALYGKAVWNER